MPRYEISLLLRYGCAVVTIALATWIRLLLDPALGSSFPFTTIFFAILLTAWYGGFRPALAAAVLGGLSASYFIMTPRFSFALEDADQQVGMVLYAFTSLGIAALGGSMHAERRRSAAITQAQRRLSALIDQSYGPVLVWDWNGPITFWNRGAERLYGFSRAEALGRVSHELLRTKPPGGVQAFVRALELEDAWEGELEHTTSAGKAIVVETRMVRVREADRSYVLEANRDITGRRQLERELREASDRLEARVRERTAELARTVESLRSSEERFRLLVESVQEYAIFMLDLEGRIVTWNAGAERNKGYRQDEILGRHFSCFYPPEDVARGKPEQELQQALAKGRCVDEGWRVRKDGSRFWASVVITTIHDNDGKPCGFAKVTRDITAGMRAREMFTQAVESALNAMVIVDSQGKITLVNAQTERMFGYGRDEMIGQPVEMLVPQRLRGKHPDLRNEFFAKPQVRQMGYGRDLFGRRKDGSEFTVEIALNPITTDEGLVVLCAIVDVVTDRQRAEERFRQAVESAPNGMVMINAAGKIVLVNTQTERLFGYQRDELLGQPIELLVPERFRSVHPERRTSFFDTPQVRSMGAGRDLFGRRKDGSEFPVEIGLNPIRTEQGTLVLSAIVDITERKRAENALRAERDRFANIVSTVPVVICSFRRRPDGTSCFPFANPAIERIFGFRPEEMAEDASSIFSRIHPDDVDGVLAGFDVSAGRMTPWRGEFRVRNPERGELWVEGHLLPTAEPDGAVLWQGYVADITERKRADEALRDRERLLSFVTGSARVGLVVVDADYRYRFANEAYAEIFDLKSLDLVGARVSEVLAAGWSQIQPKLDLALAGEQVAYELALPPVPGKREARYFTVVYEPRIGAGGAPTVVVVAVDISERKRFEMALLESERRFRLAQQAARIGSFDSNVQTDVNIWTNELEALYGLEPGEFPRTQSAWERLLHPEDRAEAVRCIERALETGLPTEGEWRVIWPDGSQHWIAGRFQMFKDEAGKPHRLTGVNLDVTDRKQAAASLERANADLERGMHQLGQINRELRVKTQENEAFVYSVSHDLRSPLVNLQGFSKELDRSAKDLRALVAASDFTQASRERALTTLDGAVAKSLRFIQTAVGRLSSIIDALLRLSRAGRVVFQRQRVDVQSIVARVVDSLKITREERKATIEVGELPDALGDAAAIEQVFANLIGNALNYLDEQRPGRIEIGNIETSSGGRPNESTTYFVRDNGLGIQEAGRAKVFQPFQRLHPQAAAGEGMGLAIVQRVVERQGGSIWFESIFGQGTTFFVTLPAYPAGTSVDLASEIRSDTGKGARS